MPWLLGALVLVLLAAGSWVVLGTSMLGVREIRVTGSQIASEEQVRAVAAVFEGTPLARVDTGAVSERVRTLPSVAAVSVSRSWPTTLVIAVTERVPVAVVAMEGGFAVLDGQGVVFETLPTRPDGTVLLKIARPQPDDPATRAGLRVLAALPPALRDPLVQIVVESPTRIRLELRAGRVVVWGDADHSAAKAEVAVSLLRTPAKTIDVSSPDVATTS
jgi:cell division protein FtsQ